MNGVMKHDRDDWLDIGMSWLCMINLWLVGETWLWYVLDVIP